MATSQQTTKVSYADIASRPAATMQPRVARPEFSNVVIVKPSGGKTFGSTKSKVIGDFIRKEWKLVAVAISSRTKAGEINPKDVMDAVSKVCADHVTNQQPSTKDTKPKRKRSSTAVPKTDVVGQSVEINPHPKLLLRGLITKVLSGSPVSDF
ncbi:hypothetical protein LOTGIDRAFT_174589 [Lottia gigantea]|uniref:Uncharacterized protein n=1 Tax=Lottia gigantea TaxID=225164 RepID=V4AQM6_LOTGI|nr:hypothetical protein LOTGIDRAFT_174589 [Lottia gigantea]ESO97130.1 hypothetical protein LOTGIDRAFT_174589 [Lottia gigantea]